MQLYFLGTSAGSPTRQRNVSGIALIPSDFKSWFLVDCGEGTQQQIIKSPLSLNKLSGIFITHVHGDHLFGLPGLLASAGLAGRKLPLPVYAPASVKSWLEFTLKTSETWLPYELIFFDWQQPGTFPVELEQVAIDTISLSHRVPCSAFSFTEKNLKRKLNSEKLSAAGLPPGPLWSQLVKGENVSLDDGRTLLAEDYLLAPDKARKVVVCGDNDQPELLSEALQDADVWIHEATLLDADMSKAKADIQHASAKAVAKVAQAAGLKHLVLTHFSARYSAADMVAFEQEVSAVFGGNCVLARDLMHLELRKNLELNNLSVTSEKPVISEKSKFRGQSA